MVILLVIGIFSFSFITTVPDIPPWVEGILMGIASTCFGVAAVVWLNMKDKIKNMERKIEKLETENRKENP